MRQIDFSVFEKEFKYRNKFPKKSLGEIKVMVFLDEHNIAYIEEQEATLYDSNGEKLNIRVDFYIPQHNLIIEYNGIQHYRPVEDFGGKLAFKKQVKRDTLLRNNCAQFGINLIEIHCYSTDNVWNEILKICNC